MEKEKPELNKRLQVIEKWLSIASILLAAIAFACILFFQSVPIMAASFTVMFLLLIAVEVVFPVYRVRNIFFREKKLLIFPAVYLLIYVAALVVTIVYYLAGDNKFIVPLCFMIAIMLLQIIMPMYQMTTRFVLRSPKTFPLYYAELKAKQEEKNKSTLLIDLDEETEQDDDEEETENSAAEGEAGEAGEESLKEDN